jgi:hypothetical protein
MAAALRTTRDWLVAKRVRWSPPFSQSQLSVFEPELWLDGGAADISVSELPPNRTCSNRRECDVVFSLPLILFFSRRIADPLA